MEFTVSKSDFKNAIGLTRKALSKVVIQEERGHLLFKVNGPTMTIQATNNDLKARCSIDVTNSSGEDFSFTADPKILEKLISKVEVQDINIDFDKSALTVRVYTTDSKKSFTTLQSFPPDKMLTFEDPTKRVRTEHTVNKAALVFALEFADNFLAPKKEEQKQYDFVVINKGIVFSSNGTNKMGFVALKTLEPVIDMKIRKLVLPLYVSFVEGISDPEIKLIDTDKDIGIESLDGKFYFSFLKSTLESPQISREFLKSEAPYITLDKSRLLKITDRLLIGNSSSSMVGIEFNLTGDKDTSNLELKLVSTKEAVETIVCTRVGDTDQLINRVIDSRTLKAVVGSFDTDKDVRLHICDNGKSFKIFNSGDVEGNKYVLAGIGAYARIVK